jgi:glycosyltransferase involved in cell wall biosynthesis
MRLEALGIDPRKIERIYNGIEAPPLDHRRTSENIFRVRYGWSEAVKLVAFVGQIAEHKGLLDFIEAARILSEQQQDIKMLIVGRTTGEYFKEVKERVGDLGLEQMVVFCGFEENTAKIFSSIDILVVPSRKEDPAPLVAVEAMAVGKPVIVTRSGGLPELVGNDEQGFVVEKRDAAAIADRILRLLANETLAMEMGQAGRAKVERMFSIKSQVLLLEDCLKRASKLDPMLPTLN